MKIEFTRAEVEHILLEYAYKLTAQEFTFVESVVYREMPDSFVVSQREKDAAQ